MTYSKQYSMQYDVFNGDADGIFALQQLRLASPVPGAQLVTGVKRDIQLLSRIEEVQSAAITVLDISLDKNRDALVKMLANNNHILYVDHHFAGDIPDSVLLESHIEPSAQTCTSLIVSELTQGRYLPWAICGAYGDNLHDIAGELATKSGLERAQTEILAEIGELFNYNGYGEKIEDLHIHPAQLYREIAQFEDPFTFYRSTELVRQLRHGYKDDMARAAVMTNIATEGNNRVYRFPAASWARRVAGVYSNLKAREEMSVAHVVIVEKNDGSLQISVRAPLTSKKNADILCRRYPSGGGRAAAAGINALPAEMLEDFLQDFYQLYR